MRILFIDIDGVFNHQPWLGNSEDLRRETWSAQLLLCPRSKDEIRREYDLSHICPENVLRLNELVEQADCHIVISSTWRKLHARDEIASLFAEKGFLYPERIIDMTDTGPGIRGTQIHRWLLAHEGDVEGMCIIDDDSDMEPYKTWLVKTNFFDGGLLKKHVQFAVNLLLEKFEPQNKSIYVEERMYYIDCDPEDYRGTIEELLSTPGPGDPTGVPTAAERAWLEALADKHNQRYLTAGEKKKLSDLEDRLLK